MATKNLSDYNVQDVPSGQGMKIGIVVSEWNEQITKAMAQGAFDTLVRHKVDPDDIRLRFVPGTFELPLGGLYMSQYTDVDAVILIGCVIQGETRHFDYICQGVTTGTTSLSLEQRKPFIFGVLTVDDEQQAFDRAGGRLGNKGDEAAITAIKMVALSKEMRQSITG